MDSDSNRPDRVGRQVWRAIEAEETYQDQTLCLVASRSVVHPLAAAACRSAFANVTTEGYPGRRYHAGSRNADEIERLAIAQACATFGARYANVQSHSASTANLAVLTALLKPGDTLLSLDLKSGGHLTHGSTASVTGRYFRAIHYRLDEQGRIDMRQVERLADEHRPTVIICGSSAYPRTIDFAAFRRIADEYGSTLVADISHTAGLTAAGLHPSPVPHAHITTLCTHKQLFGPKGGLILSGRDADTPLPERPGTLGALIDRAVFPSFQGSPDMGAIAGKAWTLGWAATPEFHQLMVRVLALATQLSESLETRFDLVSGGTDSHLLLADLRRGGITGQHAESVLEAAGILANRNRVPGESTPASVTSGLRFGTNIAAYRDLCDPDFQECCDLVVSLLDQATKGDERCPSSTHLAAARARIAEIMAGHPIPTGARRNQGAAR